MEDAKDKSKLENAPKDVIDSMPHDAALNVLSRLPISSLMHIRSVSQSWRILSLDPHLPSLHLFQAMKNNPSIIFHCDNPIRNSLYFVEISDQLKEYKVRKIEIPFCASMPDFDIVGSCNGLVCLSDTLYKDPICIYNPFTGNYLELPKSRQFEYQSVVFGFGFHPVIQEYKVVKIVYYRNQSGQAVRIPDYVQSDVSVHSLGSKVWRGIGKTPYSLDRRPLQAPLVNGRLHWMSTLGDYHGFQNCFIMISFDLADEQFREVPTPESGVLDRKAYELGVLGGCLSVSFFTESLKLEIWVLKEYEMRVSWVREFVVEDYLPRVVNQDSELLYKIWQNAMNRRIVRVLCLLKSGHILLEYRRCALALYKPDTRKFEDVQFQGIPKLFQAVVHVGSLNWISHN